MLRRLIREHGRMKPFPKVAVIFLFSSIALGQVKIITNSLPPGTVGEQYSAIIATSRGEVPFIWAVPAGSLPPGFTLTPSSDTRSATLSGMPTATAAYDFTISVEGHGRHVSTENYILTLQQQTGSTPVITSSTSETGAVGSAFSYQIAATNSPTSFAATDLPAGLTVNTSTGLISGTPTLSGTSAVTISATNADGTGSAPLALTIASTSYSVTLSWAPSPPPSGYTILGYNILRGTTSGGPYTQLNPSLIAGTTYKDTTVADGTTYYYVSTAVDSSNAQSEYSNQSEAAIP